MTGDDGDNRKNFSEEKSSRTLSKDFIRLKKK